MTARPATLARPLLIAASLALPLSASRHALAQQAPTRVQRPDTAAADAPGEESSGPLNISFAAGETYAFRSDIDGADASVASARTDLGLNFNWRAGEEWHFGLLLDGELSFYDWDNADTILPGVSEPHDDLFSAGVLLRANWAFRDPWFVTAGVFTRSGWERDADAADGFTIGGYGAIGYSFSDALTIALGVGVSSRLDDNLTPFPFISFRWKVSDRVTLTSRALGLSLTYAASDRFDVTLGGGFDRREYRLSDDRAVIPEGVARADRVPIGVELAWKPAGGLVLALTGGVLIYQHVEYLNDNGNELIEMETDPAAFVGLRLEYSF